MSKELVVQGQESEELQPVRIINVWNQKDRTEQEVHTAARTWGEFKAELSSEINFKNLRGVVRHNRNILEVDDALLPEESFSMFLFPQKVKSGLAMRTKQEYMKTMNSKQLRAECSKRGLGTSGTKEEFAQKLADDDKKNLDKRGTIKKAPIVTKSAKKAETAVVKAPSTSKEVAPAGFPAVLEAATVTTEMSLRITDKDALSNLLAAQFPNMEVVEIDAQIALKATLKLGKIVAPTPVKKEKPTSVKKEAKVDNTLPPSLSETKKKKKKVVHEVPSKEQMKEEADQWAKDFL